MQSSWEALKMGPVQKIAIWATMAGSGWAFGSVAAPQERSAAQQQTPATQHPGAEDQPKEGKEAPIPPEKSSVTHHELSMGGKPLKYTATAGTLLIRDEEDKAYGSMFYVGYTLDGADAGTRPISFLYNGG